MKNVPMVMVRWTWSFSLAVSCNMGKQNNRISCNNGEITVIIYRLYTSQYRNAIKLLCFLFWFSFNATCCYPLLSNFLVRVLLVNSFSGWFVYFVLYDIRCILVTMYIWKHIVTCTMSTTLVSLERSSHKKCRC